MPLVIALTGGIGSGKSSVADLLGEFGAVVVDTDAISHQLTAGGQPGALRIGEEFGVEYETLRPYDGPRPYPGVPWSAQEYPGVPWSTL